MTLRMQRKENQSKNNDKDEQPNGGSVSTGHLQGTTLLSGA